MEQKPRIEKIAKWATIGWVVAYPFLFIINILAEGFLINDFILIPGAEVGVSHKYENLFVFFVNLVDPITLFILLSFMTAIISWIYVSVVDFKRHAIRKKVLAFTIFHLLIILFSGVTLLGLL